MPPITTADVARKGSISVRTVLRLVSEGELPYITKFPTPTGGYLYDEETVDRVLAARAEQKSSAA